MYHIRKLLSFMLIFVLILSNVIPTYAASSETYCVSSGTNINSFVFDNQEDTSEARYIQAPILTEDTNNRTYSDEYEVTTNISVSGETIAESQEYPDEEITEAIVYNHTEEASTEDLSLTTLDNSINESADDDNASTQENNSNDNISQYSLEELYLFPRDSIRYQLVNYAINYLGNPYVWGGTSLTDGTDCSGFTQSIYKQYQINIPRTASRQYEACNKITKNHLQPGDLIFYSDVSGIVNHVAIYIGDQKIVHASSASSCIKISDVNYRDPYAYGSYLNDTNTNENEEDESLLQIYGGFYVSNVVGNYYNGVRASAYTIGYGSNNNVGMGLCCNHGASTASLNSSLTQSNDTSELESYGYSKEIQFYMAILCSIAPYANDGKLNNTYFNWSDFGCTVPSQANALCALACSYLCGRNYGGVSQAVQLANWVKNNCNKYWDFWGYIENATLSNTTQNNINKIVIKNGKKYYMSTPMQLTGNKAGSTFKITATSITMQAVVSNSDTTSQITTAFTSQENTSNETFYKNAFRACIDQNQYITFFYPVSYDTIGKTVAATVIPTKSGGVFRLNYFFPNGSYQPVVMCDGGTTQKEFYISLTSEKMHEIIIKKESKCISITDDNPNYSLEGATYNIYNEQGEIAEYFTSSDGSTAKAINLKTDKKGNLLVKYNDIYTARIHVLPGVYYIKETKASPGYQLDSCSDEKSKGHCADVREKTSATITCKERPVSSMIPIRIFKKTFDNEDASKENDLSGAIFQVSYYNKIYDNYTEISGAPTRMWYIETKNNNTSNYYAKLSPAYLSDAYVSSDFYTDLNDNITLPLGTVIIKEIRAPENYYTVNFHGSYDDGINHIEDVTSMREGTFFGTIRTDTESNSGASVCIGNTMDSEMTHMPVYENLSITYTDRKMPTLKTQALIDETGCNIGCSTNNMTCYDMVSVTGVSKGKTYTVLSKLIDKESNTVVRDINGNPCIQKQEFCATKEDDVWKVYIGNISGEQYAGKKLVIQEYLKWDEKTIASETDLDNTEQTIFIPEITTKALVNGNTSYGSLEEDSIIQDYVSYNGLIPGKSYSLKGKLMYKNAEGEVVALLDNNGNPCISSKTFVPAQENGTEVMEFHLESSMYQLEGLQTVIYEDLIYQEHVIATHSDMNDANQTIYYPKAKTTLTSNQTNMHNIVADNHIELTDVVSYSNLEIGSTHIIKGTLMNKATGEPIMDENGNAVTSEVEFIPEKIQDEISVPYSFNINKKDLTNLKEIVCYENIYRLRDNRHIIRHEDINDVEQTVFVPKIQTKAWDKTSKSNIAEAKKEITIIDTVHYSGLIKGESYTLKGILMLKSENREEQTTEAEKNHIIIDQNGIQCYPLIIQNKKITGEISFIAEDTNGTVDVTYVLDASELNGKSVVVFENLYYNNILLASHNDINCKEQTIQFISRNGEISIHADNLIQGGGSHGNGHVKTGDTIWIPFLFFILTIILITFNILCFYNRKKFTSLFIKLKNTTLMLLFIFCVSLTVSTEVCASHYESDTLKTSTLSRLTKTYSNLSEKNEHALEQTIQKNGKTYKIKSVSWEEIPVQEQIEYTLDYGYCTQKPECSATYQYTYYSSATQKTETVVLPLVQLYEGDKSWIDGFRAIATFTNIENGIFSLDGHEFEYTENMIFSDQDYIALINMLGFDSSLYRLTSYEWKGEAYLDYEQNLCRDAILYGQQYATEYKAYYSDTIKTGSKFNATVIYEEIQKQTTEQRDDNKEQIESKYNMLPMQEKDSLSSNQNNKVIEENTVQINQELINTDPQTINPDNNLVTHLNKKKQIKTITNMICIIIIIICLFILFRNYQKKKAIIQKQKNKKLFNN